MLKPVLAFSALVLLGLSLQQPAATPAPSSAPAVNPFKPNAEAIAKAKKVYGYDCAVCHGETGDGKGDVPMKVKLKDFTNAADLQGETDGDLFKVIKNGKGDMPPEGGRMKDEDLWSLVVVVRSFSKK